MCLSACVCVPVSLFVLCLFRFIPLNIYPTCRMFVLIFKDMIVRIYLIFLRTTKTRTWMYSLDLCLCIECVFATERRRLANWHIHGPALTTFSTANCSNIDEAFAFFQKKKYIFAARNLIKWPFLRAIAYSVKKKCMVLWLWFLLLLLLHTAIHLLTRSLIR